MGKKFNVPKDNNILKISLEDAMSDNYLPYAVEVAKDRALPDVRDGLKPVHRRILYGAHNLKAHPDRAYLKSARIVGDILGKYHPHGDSSVYDAMVILAQDFSTREPLVDGHGNWGSIDGDNAAAMRYTEARLSEISMEMLRDIEHGVVNMVDNYSNSEKEPEVLPARYPNLLVNGCFGIAVGLSTNIPPHNLTEVINGVVALADNKDITDDELMDHIKGPDLPTGGKLMGVESIKAAYKTGKGKVTLRAKTEIEKLENGRLGIVITEFPYRKNKAKLLHSISEMTGDKRHAKMLEGITDIRDESDRHGIRSVIEFKKSCERDYVEKTLKYLFKKTDLQSNISFNMIALVNGKPELLGLRSMLNFYLDHQKEVITRRTIKYLESAEKRFHIVEGLIKAIGIMDEVIKTIRESKSKKDASNNLIEKFGFTEIQSTAILEMMLYRLTGLEIVTFEKEYNQLEKAIKRYKKILSSEKELLKVFKSEILEIRDKYGNDRRTEIIENMDEAKIDKEELIIVEDIMITLSREGYIKRIPLKSFNRTSGDVSEIEYREGDYNTHLIKSNTKESLLFFTSQGVMYKILAADIPEKKWRDKGEKLDLILKGYQSDSMEVVELFSVDAFENQKEFVFVGSYGGMRSCAMSEFESNYTKISGVNLKNNEKLRNVFLMNPNRQRTYIEIDTVKGLNYVLDEPVIEQGARNSVLIQKIPIVSGDEILNANYKQENMLDTFPISISKKNEVLREWKRTEHRVYTESNGCILMMFEDGGILNVPSLILQNIGDGININEVIPEELKGVKLVGLHAVQSGDFDKEVIIPTLQGIIKKCKFSDFIAEGYSLQATKILPGDKMLKPFVVDEKQECCIIVGTAKGRVVKFTNSSLSTIGKNSKGVISISLKEDDSVVFADFIPENSENKYIIKFNNGDNIEIDTADIPLKSRGTVGVKAANAESKDGIKEVRKLK